MAVTREQALGLWHKYNESESLFHHALAVEAVMREAAEKHGDDPDFWGITGLLHDVDWERFPEEHCRKAPELLKEINAPEEMVHAVCAHGWGICSDIKPESYMEKMLFTIDELTGLVTATALMRPEKMKGISVKSVKKKWNAHGFAAGVNREIIEKGAAMIEMEIPAVIQLTIDGMAKAAPELGLWPEEE